MPSKHKKHTHKDMSFMFQKRSISAGSDASKALSRGFNMSGKSEGRHCHHRRVPSQGGARDRVGRLLVIK